ncbi:MAG TPA: TIGR04290 family methyltransferase [Longimicrobiales bacterium]|nr:TIGR04290 family methyltransferase [Longimicrobiales bacterium]
MQTIAPQHVEAQRAAIARMAPWFHNIHLPSGEQTAPDHWLGDFPSAKWKVLQSAIPERLDGWTALDIGCNAGFYSVELARRGANVVGIDSDPHYLRQARWVAREMGVADSIEFREMQVYDLAGSAETFDLVWFMGVFYHLRYPLLGLDIVAEKVRRMLVFQTLTMPGDDVCSTETDGTSIDDREMFLQPGWPKMAFIEHAFVSDPTNWWAANHAGVEAMLRSSGFSVTQRPGHEIYICEPNGEAAPRAESAEFRAATGRRNGSRSGALNGS